MKLGTFDNGWWHSACTSLGYDPRRLPTAHSAGGGAYAQDLSARLEHGVALCENLQNDPVDVLLGHGGMGLAFVPDGADVTRLQLAHELAGATLCSQLIDPLTTVFASLDWPIVWQSLQSSTWIKAIWDRAQVHELQQFGIPSVTHLPMAAPDRAYDTTPLDPARISPIVSFVGGQNTSFFHANSNVESGGLLAGALVQGMSADLPQVSFYEAYHNLYGLAAAPAASDTPAERVQMMVAYFNAKLFYNASLCLKNRDRFAVFLKRRLGDQFHLIGPGWDRAYGLAVANRFATTDEYLNHFRTTAVNLNFVNGNAESGLNMRHFEITAAGGFMLCYKQPELADHFEIGTECAVFENEGDLLDKIDYYLNHSDERIAIARAGQRRTLSEHLYSHRVQSLMRAARPQPIPVEYSTGNVWETFREVVPRADVVLDCGANIGQTAKSLRNLYPEATLYSFEPVSSVFEQLEATCKEIGAHAVNQAVSDEPGTATMHLTVGGEAHSLLGFLPDNPCARWTREVGRETVTVCTLDGWCAEQGIDTRRVDVIKLDIQGAEMKALYGARKLLETVKLIYVEVSFVPLYAGAPLFEEIEAFLCECGYRRHAVFPSDQPHHWGDAIYVKQKT